MATKDEERAARLKAALRDNLRRRKVQARGRADDAPEGDATEGDATETAPEPAPTERSAEKG